MMHQFLGVVVLTGILGFGTATLASADDPMPVPPKDPRAAPAAQPMKGELLRIEGEYYVVKDVAGKEVRLQVSKDTVLDARLKAGDKIDAQVLPDGRALMILKALE
jgi:hypothetical protein